MYVKKVYDLGKVRIIEKHYPGRYGAPGMKRRKKQLPTPEQMERENERRKARKVQMLILRNFQEGDWHLTLSYKPENRPEDMPAAKKRLQKFLRDLRKIYRKEGKDLKYIAVTERGERGACHHHLILEDIPGTKQAVIDCWKDGGRYFVPLYEDGEYEKLGDYIAKKQTKEQKKGQRSFSRSKNLILPKPKIEKIQAVIWRSVPIAPKGWCVLNVENGINPFNNQPYQRYTIKTKEALCRDP